MIYIKPGNDGVYFLLDITVVDGLLTGTFSITDWKGARGKSVSGSASAHVAYGRPATSFPERVRWHCWDWACSDSAWLAASRLPDHCTSRREGPTFSAGPVSSPT
jgi:hypothetical protein